MPHRSFASSGTCVIGHANPDTDAICSAIAYAHLLREVSDPHAFAARAGELRPDTAWVLQRFSTTSPTLVTDVRPRVRDMMSAPVITADLSASLLEVARTLRERDLRSLPIIDDQGYLHGLISLEDFARFFLEGSMGADAEDIPLDFDAVVRAIDGTVLVEARDRPLNDKVRVAASSIQIVLERIPPDGVAVVGDRHDAQEALIHHGVAALIVTGGLPVRKEIVTLARQHHVALISCPHHTFETVRLINMSVPARFFMHTDPVTVRETDFLDDVRYTLTTQRGVPVVDNQGHPVGMLARSDLLDPARRPVALVDHNELGQAAEGIDQAEIRAIIDHHRIATVQTSTPIFLRFEPVGATATIIATLYREAGVALPPNIAGLLLAAIVTDTVLFRSPTCTARDRATASELADLIGIDPEDLGREIFSRSFDIAAMSPRELLHRDFKEFGIQGHLYGIAAIETGNATALTSIRTQLLNEMDSIRRQRPFEVVLCLVVDVISEQTDVLISGYETIVAEVLGKPLLPGRLVELPYIVSRKKQVVPLLDDIDARSHA
ncbi:MAG: putative manganese-dependent inorganic diphosphatase [Chloroflexi bacterium]|nr:putative manganese-dependent inorganic diphosphatase [Chloroflexota bacterium]